MNNTDIVLAALPTTGITKISALERRIELGREDIRKISDKIDLLYSDQNGVESNIFGHVSDTKINTALTKVKENNADCMREINKSLRAHNDNMRDVTALVKMLALAEAEIFNRVASATASMQDVDSIVLEWCKKLNVTDENLKEFITISVQHANKINLFNNEIRTLVTEASTKIDGVEQDVNKQFSEIKDALLNFAKTISKQNEALTTSQQILKESLFSKIESLKVELSTEFNVKSAQHTLKHASFMEEIAAQFAIVSARIGVLEQSVDEVVQTDYQLEDQYLALEKKCNMLMEVIQSDAFSKNMISVDDNSTRFETESVLIDTVSPSVRINFWDTPIYKLSVGIASVGALVCTLLL